MPQRRKTASPYAAVTLTATALVAVGPSLAFAQSPYTIKNLGTLCDYPTSQPPPSQCLTPTLTIPPESPPEPSTAPWTPYSRAFGVNNKGQTVGMSGIEQGGQVSVQAFRTAANGAIDPATDRLIASQVLAPSSTRAYAINDAGLVVGVATTLHQTASLNFEYDVSQADRSYPYLWGHTSDAGVLPSPPWEGAGSAAAFSIGNLDGFDFSMAGRAVTPTGIHAFLPFYVFFGDDFGYLDLGTFAGGTTSEARGINDLGQLVGFSDTGDGTRRAFVWTSGPLTGLGTLGGSSCATCESLAYAINNSGQIVGESDALLPLFKLAARHAFLIPTTSEIVLESLHDLGTLGGTLCFTCRSAAYDINESGHIVGESEIVLASSFTHAFLYRNGVMQDLNDLLPDTARALWVLTDARGINDLGQVVGTGLFEGRMRAYLLTPPAQLLVTNVQELLPILNFESPGLRESLEMKLRAAHQALRQNQQLAACNQVAAFDYEVRAQSGRGLPVVQADKLTAGADLIKTELVCQP